MTPLQLRLREFGPYTGRHEIDFTEFDDRQLFLIHGPTGSGKSAILDAMCFALYGETSGADRDGHQLRSDFADLEDPTEVRFEFRLGERTYRVVRRPRMRLPKQRGEGFTTKSEDATLWDQTEARGDAEGDPLAEGKRDVDARVEQLLGFKSGQFRQVVMLPQGKFRRFLSAGSSDREELLKVLFETQPFEDLEDTLKQMANESESQVRAIRQQRKQALNRVGVDDRDALDAQIDKATRVHRLATAWQETLDERLGDAREALESAKKDREVLDERDDARSTLNELKEREDAIQEKKSRRSAAQKAAEVAPVQANYEERQEEKAEAEEDLQKAEKELEDASEKLSEAEANLEKENERDDERESLREKKTELAGLRDDAEALQSVQKDLDEAQSKKESAQETKDEIEAKIRALEDEIDTLRGKREEAVAEAQTVDRLEGDLEKAEKKLQRARDLAGHREKLQEAQDTVDSAREDLGERKEALDAAKRRQEALQKKRMEGYATVLARDLSDGEPCPVCGSEEHPDPAAHDDEIPSPDDLDAASDAVAEAQSEVESARETVKEHETTVTRQKMAIEGILDDAPEVESTSEDELTETRDALESDLSEARQAEERVGTLDETIETKEEELDGLKTERKEAEETFREADKEVTRLESKRDTRQDKLPDSVGSVEELEEKIDEVSRRLEEMEEALKTAREEKEVAGQVAARKESERDSARETLKTAVEKRDEAENAFQAALSDAGFESVEAFEEAHLSDDERKALNEEIEAYESDRSAAEDRLQRAEEKAAEIDGEPDVDAREERVGFLDEALDLQRKRAFEVKARKDALREAKDELGDLSDDLAEAEERYAHVGHLADTARGKNDHNVSLQRFVLATRLEEVLRVANEHFGRMSQNRYHLRRETEVRDGRSASGLDLVVDDAHTGNRRSVSTLSGGEGFQASLALALGLSDVVQSIAGGRHLDTIFIDEGFGSLDADALDRAMQSLTNLQSGGRLVGIISHVSELKKRITARLEVQTSQEGSQVRVEA